MSLPRQVATLAIWPFLEQVMNFLVGFVDTALAGHLSVSATNAVGVAVYVLWFMLLLINAVGVGCTALIARAAGAGRWRRANVVLGQSVALAAAWGVLVALGLYLLAPIIGRVSGLSGESLEKCTLYLGLLTLAVPFKSILGISTACLRGAGDTRTPFFVMVLVNLINIVVSVALVADFSPIGGHGLAGVAVGTVTAWTIGGLCVLAVLARGRVSLKLIPANLVMRCRWIVRITRIGLPNLLESMGHWVGNYLILAIVGHLPVAHAVGAHIIGIRIEAVSFLPGAAMGIAAATLAGQYLGANDPRTARKAVCYCWFFGASLMTVFGVLFMVIPEILIGLVTDQPEFLATSPGLLFHAGWSQLGFGTYIVLSYAIRGAGDTRSALAMSFSSTYLVRLPLTYVLAVVFEMGLVGVWIACSAELILRGALFLARFLHGGWTRVKV